MSFRHPGPLAPSTNTLALVAWGVVLAVATTIVVVAIVRSGGAG